MVSLTKRAICGLAAACTLLLSACGKDEEITYLEQGPFESSVGGFSAQYLGQYQFANEAAASMVRMERKQALQNLTPNFKDWHVKLLYVSTDGDGDALVKFRSVTNPNIIYVVSVDHDSPLYPTIASLHLNDDAYISGNFKSGDDKDGFRELSLTEKGSMIAPEFNTSISAITASAANDVTPVDASVNVGVSENEHSTVSTIKTGTCKLQVSGKVLFDKKCKYKLEVGGSFTIYENYGGSGYFAMLERDGNSANGYWNGARDSDHAQDGLGPMTRQGACWADEAGSSEMCLWGS